MRATVRMQKSFTPHRSTPRLPHVKKVVDSVDTENRPEHDGAHLIRGQTMRAPFLAVAATLTLAVFALSGVATDTVQLHAQQTIKKVDMGDYEPVVPWPKPLPD